MSKAGLKAALLLVFLLIATYGCPESLFFDNPESLDPLRPQAALEVLTGPNDSSEAECSLRVDPQDSVLLLQVEVGQAYPESLRPYIFSIEIEVIVGLTSGGLIIADTVGLKVDTPGTYPLALPVENTLGLQKGANQVTIVSLSRYLNGEGKMMIPLGRRLRNCVLYW